MENLLKSAATLALAVSLISIGPAARAQTSDGVSVDLGAIDQSTADPTVLTPVPGRIVLTPPPGTNPISRPATGLIKLKPPASMKQASAPRAPSPSPAPKKTAKAEPAAAVVARSQEPTPPAPMPPAAAPVAPVQREAPVVAAAPPPAMAPPATSELPRPSAAAAQTAASEPAGPMNTPLARDTAPAPAPAPEQAAALPPADQNIPTDETTEMVALMFDAGSATVSGEAQGKVGELAKRMSDDRALRVQLLAYASDPDKNTSKARRMALDRAVSVRNMLIDAGVERTRIEVRALGDQGDAGPADRVDAIAIRR